MMSCASIGRVLGLTKAQVQFIERRALAKIRKALGVAAHTEPAWLHLITRDAKQLRCGACNELGHNRRTCARAK